MGGRHAAVVPAVFEDVDDAHGSKSPKSPKSDAMDVDVEVDGQEPVTAAGTERVSGSPSQQSVQSPVSRSVPSRMASLLNNPDEEEEPKHATRSTRDASEASGSNTHTPRSSSLKAASVARDISGRPLLPLEMPHASLIKLGEISSKDGFHNSRFIYPIGYELNRKWFSSVNPSAEVNYNCQILEGPDGPVFQVIAEDRSEDDGGVVRKSDPSEAWAPFLMEIASIRNKEDPVPSAERGEEQFGLANDTIRALIQELPRARELPKYEWRQVEGS